MSLEVRYGVRPDGGRLAYAVLGSGPPLVWIPGWINHLEVMWERPTYRRFFERLARHHTVILYDKHGVGLSDRDRREFTLGADAADLEVILDELEIPRATLLGNSQAGAVACRFAVEQPSRVERMILHGAWAHHRQTNLEGAYEAVLGLIEGHWGLAARLFTDLFVPDASADDRAWFARFQRECADADVARGMLQLCVELDVRAILPRVDVPTLVLHRDGDRIAPLPLGRELAQLIPGASFLKIPGRAHFPWEGEADAVLSAIERFLGVDEVDRSSPEPATPAVGHDAKVGEPAGRSATLRCDGEVWVVGFAGEASLLKDVKGLRYLAELLRRPGIEAHVVELVAAVEGTRGERGGHEPDLVARQGPDGDVGPLLDRRAVSRYRERVAELRCEVEEAQTAHDVDRAAACQADLDAIAEQLAATVGLGGRDRAAATTVERARVKVTRLLRDAVRRIEQVDPQLGYLLDTTVRTGTYCVYEPPPGNTLRWEL